MCANGVFVGFSDTQKSATDVFELLQKPAKPLDDYTAENDFVFKRRMDQFSGWQGIPKRITGGTNEITETLRDEIEQLFDLVEHLKSGKLHHARGISARLRMLVATGKPLPVLQMYAAMKQLPLIVYTTPNIQGRVAEHSEPGALVINLTISSVPDHRFGNPVDLDVWLDFPAGRFNERTFSNREMIKHIGDTIGSHFDKDMLPMVVSLRATRTELYGKEADFMVIYLGEVAAAILDLAQDTLEAGESS
jgi:hypothetical protein